MSWTRTEEETRSKILPRTRTCDASLVAQSVKNLPAMWETWIRSLSWEDLLEERMATYASTLAWRIPKDRGAFESTVHGVDMTERLSTQHRTCEASQATVKGLRSERKRQCRISDFLKCMLSQSI